jgi:hypothetical protein
MSDMKVEEILELWKVDAVIDRAEISDEAVKTAKLHHKYIQILVHERLLLRSLESDMKKLKLEKYEFFTQGPNEETQAKGWKLPAKGIILKADIPMYMDADPEVVKLSLRIGMQQEKVTLLESIINMIIYRGNSLKVAVDWQRFINGS